MTGIESQFVKVTDAKQFINSTSCAINPDLFTP